MKRCKPMMCIPTCARGEQKDPRLSVFLVVECVNLALPLLPGHGAVDAARGVAGLVEEGVDQVQHLGHLAEDQHLGKN